MAADGDNAGRRVPGWNPARGPLPDPLRRARSGNVAVGLVPSEPGRRGPHTDLLRHRRALAARLLRWYDANRRPLPWRRSSSPYRTLVSEIMLQQTRAETAISHYRRFLRRFPSFRALARASEQEVLAVWEGLGYYGRARNLLRTARAVAERGGRLPRETAALRELPGIGPYTAAAVASIAYGAREPALDGNVERVMARLLALPRPPALERGALRDLLRGVVPAARPGDFNQALMELGATVCAPRRPACEACPLRPFCRAYALGRVKVYPRRLPRPSLSERAEQAVLLRWRNRFLLRRRPEHGLLGGLWAFPTYPARAAALRRFRAETGLVVRRDARLAPIRHAYSHFRLVLTPLLCSVAAKPAAPVPDPFGWFDRAGLDSVPMGKADRLALAALVKVSP